jgi:Trp operon repressor
VQAQQEELLLLVLMSVAQEERAALAPRVVLVELLLYQAQRLYGHFQVVMVEMDLLV